MTTPTRLPRKTSGFFRIVASGGAQDGSITTRRYFHVIFMASTISCSDAVRISVTWFFTKCQVNSLSGTLSPSAIVSGASSAMMCPALKLR